jgi:hypothetical protein
MPIKGLAVLIVDLPRSKSFFLRAFVLAIGFALASPQVLSHELNFGDPAVCPIFEYLPGTEIPVYRISSQEDVEGFADVVGGSCSVLDGVLQIGLEAGQSLDAHLSPITDLSSLVWLREIGALSLQNVPGLINLSGLDNLRGETQSIIIRDAPHLQNIESLSGLSGLMDFGHGALGVAVERTALKSLYPIGEFSAYGSYWDFVVRENPVLSDCAWPDVGDKPENIILRDNFVGCNSIAEVSKYRDYHRHELKIAVLPGGKVLLDELSANFVMTSAGLITGEEITDPLSEASVAEVAYWGSVPIPSGYALEIEASPDTGFDRLPIESNCFGGVQYFGGERWVISSMRDDCYVLISFDSSTPRLGGNINLHSSVCRATTSGELAANLTHGKLGTFNGGEEPVDILCPISRQFELGIRALLKRLYATVLNEMPDVFLDRIEEGYIRGEYEAEYIIRDFYESVGYWMQRDTDKEFVAALYGALFNREGEDAGIEYWTGEIERSSREAVLDFFLGSTEFLTLRDALLLSNTSSSSRLELIFAPGENVDETQDGVCRLFDSAPTEALLSDSIKELEYFRVPTVALGNGPLTYTVNFSDIDSDISSFVLECSLQAGVGLAGIAFRD